MHGLSHWLGLDTAMSAFIPDRSRIPGAGHGADRRASSGSRAGCRRAGARVAALAFELKMTLSLPKPVMKTRPLAL